MSDRTLTCRERVRARYKDRMADIRKLWKLNCKDPETNDPDLGQWDEYGLSFGYVPRGTFSEQKRGYWRYQLSWGGPADEFRFYCDEDYQLTKVEYWFLDWYDGAHVSVTRKNRELWDEIWADWLERESPQYAKKVESTMAVGETL